MAKRKIRNDDPQNMHIKLKIESFLTQIFHGGHPSRSGDCKAHDFNLTKMNPWFSSFLVTSNALSRKS
jgi:hypothetical protein